MVCTFSPTCISHCILLHQAVDAVASTLQTGTCNPCSCCRATASQANRLTHLCKQDYKETSIAQTAILIVHVAILIVHALCKLAGVNWATHYQSCSQTKSITRCKPYQICHSCMLRAKKSEPPQQADQGCAVLKGPRPCCLHQQASTT